MNRRPSALRCAFFINRTAWNKLPSDLKWIVGTAAKETALVDRLAGKSYGQSGASKDDRFGSCAPDDETIDQLAKRTKGIIWMRSRPKYPDD